MIEQIRNRREKDLNAEEYRREDRRRVVYTVAGVVLIAAVVVLAVLCVAGLPDVWYNHDN